MNEDLKKELDQTQFTCRLVDFVDILLRLDEKIEIPNRLVYIAEVLREQTKHKCYVHIEFRENSIVIWNYKHWVASCEKWKADKERSNRERVERYIFSANIERIIKAAMSYFNIDKSYADYIAFSYLHNKKHQHIKAIGVTLITKEEEL